MIVRTDDYLADYRLLGLQPGCSLQTLERTWRRAVSALHPDRSRAEGLEPAAAQQRLFVLTQAYRRLREFERQHGRLPGGAAPALAPQAGLQAPAGAAAPPTPTAVAPDSEDAAPAAASVDPALPASPYRSRGRRFALGGIALGLAVGVFGWPRHEAVEGPGQPLLPAAAGSLGLGEPVQREPQRARIKLGYTQAEVEALLGPPLLRNEDDWEYGPSHVRFERGRVVGWYSSPMRPLPVDRPVR